MITSQSVSLGCEPHLLFAGGTYRFRFTDGRWHLGLVTAIEGNTNAELRFLTPTSEAMLGGVLLPVAGLRPAPLRDRDVTSLPSGSRVIARLPQSAGADPRVWQECQVLSFGRGGRTITVQSEGDDGSFLEATTLPIERVAVSQYADSSSDEAGYSDLGSESEREGEFTETAAGRRSANGHAAVASIVAAQSELDPSAVRNADTALQEASAAVQNAVTAGRWQGRVFGDFEAHTRGIGSKLLAAMGFRAGTGLGINKQGIAAALQVQASLLCTCIQPYDAASALN